MQLLYFDGKMKDLLHSFTNNRLSKGKRQSLYNGYCLKIAVVGIDKVVKGHRQFYSRSSTILLPRAL